MFIQTLPDRSRGQQILYEEVDLLFYVAKMTRVEARVVNRLPIVDQLIPNGRIQVYPHSMATTETSKQLQRRLVPVQIIREDPSERYMKILSLPKDKDIRSLADNDHTFDYMLEGTSGEGSFVYVFDYGFNLSHPVSDDLPAAPSCPFTSLVSYEPDSLIQPQLTWDCRSWLDVP